MEQGYCSDWAVVGKVTPHFRRFVGELARNCVAERSCDPPWFAEHRAGEMTDPENRGLNSAAFQESMSADPGYSGEELYQVEGKDQADSFDH